jgi:hypothetical protein
MTKTLGRISVLVLALAATAGVARSDTTIVTKTNDATQTIQFSAHKLHIGAPEGGVIFRGDLKLLWMIDPEKKSYAEMTDADMKELAATVKHAMAQMKNLPPAVAEKIKGSLPGAELPKRTVKPMGVNKEINGFPCSGYTVSTEGKSVVSEVWATEPSALKIAAADMVVFKELADFMVATVPGLDAMTDWAKDLEHPMEGQVPGIPVLTIVKDEAGTETPRTELVSAEHVAIAPSVFEAPAGYEKTSMKKGK